MHDSRSESKSAPDPAVGPDGEALFAPDLCAALCLIIDQSMSATHAPAPARARAKFRNALTLRISNSPRSTSMHVVDHSSSTRTMSIGTTTRARPLGTRSRMGSPPRQAIATRRRSRLASQVPSSTLSSSSSMTRMNASSLAAQVGCRDTISVSRTASGTSRSARERAAGMTMPGKTYRQCGRGRPNRTEFVPNSSSIGARRRRRRYSRSRIA